MTRPNASDLARAEAFVAKGYGITFGRSPDHPDFAHDRAAAVHQVAMLEMGKRQDAEHRAMATRTRIAA